MKNYNYLGFFLLQKHLLISFRDEILHLKEKLRHLELQVLRQQDQLQFYQNQVPAHQSTSSQNVSVRARLGSEFATDSSECSEKESLSDELLHVQQQPNVQALSPMLRHRLLVSAIKQMLIVADIYL